MDNREAPQFWIFTKIGLSFLKQVRLMKQRAKSIRNSCDAIDCSHYVSVTAAFSIPTSAFDDLIPFRNFFAHRNDHTVNLAKAVAFSYSISQLLHPTDILCSFAYGRHQILLLDWLDDFQATAGQLCE